MADRRDMVIRPLVSADAAREPLITARQKIAERRRLDAARRRRRALRSVGSAKASRKLAQRSRRRAAGSAALTRTAAKGGAGAASGARALGGGWLTLLVVAGAAGVRIATGKSFETLAAEANELILGDSDDKARASRSARDHLSSNAQFLRSAARRGLTAEDRTLMGELTGIAEREERGKSLIAQEASFGADSFLEQLLMRAVRWIREGWEGNNGPEGYARYRRNMSSAIAHEQAKRNA